MLLDLDHFKRLNDSHGHLAGDLVRTSRDFARDLESCLRQSDIVCRWGGEEVHRLAQEHRRQHRPEDR